MFIGKKICGGFAGNGSIFLFVKFILRNGLGVSVCVCGGGGGGGGLLYGLNAQFLILLIPHPTGLDRSLYKFQNFDIGFSFIECRRDFAPKKTKKKILQKNYS